MFTSFVRSPDQPGMQLNFFEQVAEAWCTGQAVLWIDLEEPTDQELKQVGQLLNLDSECLEDCLHGEQRPRVDLSCGTA